LIIKACLRAACVAAAGIVFVAATDETRLSAANYTKYHTSEELNTELRALAKAHTNLAKVVEIAKSPGGRAVLAIEIANPSGTPVAERPALLIAANLEGDQLIGSEIALFIAEGLLSGYASNPTIKQRLDHHAFYIVPRMNPDGADAMFAPVKSFLKTNGSRFDNDNDGRLDEDGPEDLNKDGVIAMMRAKDPNGPYMVHPDDARLVRRADPAKGEAGGYAIYWEGIDNDGDGFINEDPAGGVDLNRNFQHQYPYYTPDAGPHMASEPEVRGLLDYVIARRNIAAILTFGESDNLIAAPTRAGGHAPASTVDLVAFANQSVEDSRRVGRFQGGGPQLFFGGRGGGGGRGDAAGAQAGRGAGQPRPTPPATTVAGTDLEYFRTISERYRQTTGIRTAPATRAPGGAFFEYGYYQFGVPSFSTPGWGIGSGPSGSSGPAGPTGPQGPGGRSGGQGGVPGGGEGAESGTGAFDVRIARWIDAEKNNGFIAWTPFKHPALGDVEIGGFRPYAISNPDPSKIADLGKSHVEFVTYLSSIFPKIAIANTSAASLGGGLYRVKVDVENAGFLPTSTAQGVRSRAVKPTMVQLGVNADDIVSGDAKTNFFPTLAGSGRRQSYDWIIKGKPGSSITVKAMAQKGGTATATVVLK